MFPYSKITSMTNPNEIPETLNTPKPVESLLKEAMQSASGEVTTLKDIIEDAEDLQNARIPEPGHDLSTPWLRKLGPGLITGAADDDPSGIGTYSVAGAQFGYSLLWLIPYCVPLMIAVQEMCGRVGVVTGKGLAAIIKEHYPRWLLCGVVFLLVGANVINIYADLNVMAASAQMLFHGSMTLWLTLVSVTIAALQIVVPYSTYVKFLKWLCLTLLAYVVTALLPTVPHHWGEILRHSLIPSWRTDPQFLLTVVGFLGTTISPYLFFWQASEEVEEEIAAGRVDVPGHRNTRVTKGEIRTLQVDTSVGMIASQTITFFIVICTAATLHGHGEINTAQDAARALLPLGQGAYVLFTLGIFGSGMLAIPTLAGSAAYAVSESLGWRYGLYRRFRRARGFYSTIAAMIIIGYLLNFVHSFSPIKGLLYAAAINGIVAPPLIVILLLICNNKQILKRRVNGKKSNILGWLTVVLMASAAIFFLWAIVTGKAS